jgi:hypothetical protein
MFALQRCRKALRQGHFADLRHAADEIGVAMTFVDEPLMQKLDNRFMTVKFGKSHSVFPSLVSNHRIRTGVSILMDSCWLR